MAAEKLGVNVFFAWSHWFRVRNEVDNVDLNYLNMFEIMKKSLIRMSEIFFLQTWVQLKFRNMGMISLAKKKTCSFERARNLQTMIKETDHGNNLFIITSKYGQCMQRFLLT